MRILIADDDDYTREGLAESIDWASYGITKVIQARDGEEALRIAMTRKLDIVLTDIRMPRLNGIEFAEKLTAASPDSKLLFMSGYMEVNYLKSAIKLSAVDYIEKPIRIPELEKAIRKTVDTLLQSRMQHDLADQKLKLERYKLANLLRTKEGDMNEIRRLCEETGFPINRHYIGLVLRFGEEKGEERDRLAEMIDFCARHGFPSVGERSDKGIAHIITAFRRHEEERVELLAGALLGQFPELTIGIGSVSADLSEVGKSCRDALTVLQRSFYQPRVRRFVFNGSRSALPSVRTDVVVEFVRCMKHEPELLPIWINGLCDDLIKDGTQSKERVVSMFSSFAHAMLSEKNGILMGSGRVYQIREVGALLESADSMEEIRRMMLELCETYLEEIRKTSPYSRTVSAVMKYISAHCGNADLDIRRIAEHLHMSSAHLGMLFKQETGTTIKQYINSYRLELAKQLIGNENYKMNEVAQICGYASASYFAKAFKAATNLTPVEYRKSTYR